MSQYKRTSSPVRNQLLGFNKKLFKSGTALPPIGLSTLAQIISKSALTVGSVTSDEMLCKSPYSLAKQG
jgi:hypothetical protein